MTIPTPRDYGWIRRWYPLDSAIPAVDGYLDADAAQRGFTLDGLREAPCLILLGAPGMGKSREAEAACRALKSQDAFADLVQVGRRNDPLKTLLALLDRESFAAWYASADAWHLCIDGIDEAFGGAAGFEAILRELLDTLVAKGGDLTRLRLRLLCRTVEWTPALDRLIATRWPERQVTKLQIAPLTEQDVAVAADALAGDTAVATQFVEAIAARNVEALASRPVSLRLLTDLLKETGELPVEQDELYRLGLEALANEPDPERRQRVRRGALTSAEKLTVAARIAAATAFSGLSKVWVGLEADAKPDDAFRLADIAGGAEPAGSVSFPVDDADLLDAIRTPLFELVGEDTYAFVHQTFREYLAARYLIEHSLTPEQITAFLSVADPDDRGGIAPQLREIAAWVASMFAPFFQHLVDYEPDVLLQSDVAAASPEDRERLVAALLTRLEAGELIELYYGLRSLFGRLAHPGLADQLRDYLAQADKAMFGRRGAIDIIEETHLDALAPDLARIALTPSEPIQVRKEAAYAVHRLHDDAAKRSLAPLLRADLSDDDDDELRGAVLLALWPNHLRFQDLLPALTPEKNTSLIGSYAMFQRLLELGDLSSEDAIAAIAWLRTQRPERSEGHRGREVLAKIFWGAVAQSGHPAVRDAVAAFILDAFDTLSDWILEAGEEVTPTWPTDPAIRLGVVRSILGSAKAADNAARLVTVFVKNLITTEDLPVYLEALGAEADPEMQVALAEIVSTLAYRQPLDDIVDVFDAATRSAPLLAALRRDYYVELDSSSAMQSRAILRRRQESEVREAERAKGAALADQQVIDGLDALDAGPAEEWWRLNLALFVADSGGFQGEFEFHSDLKAAPGWARLSPLNRERFTDGALRYVTESRLERVDWLGTNTQHRPASAALRALRLLMEDRPAAFAALDPEVWRTWAAATLGFFDNHFSEGGETQTALVRRTYAEAPDALLRVVARMALGPKSDGLSARVLFLLEEIYDARIGEFLERLRRRPNFKKRTVGSDLFSYLVRLGQPSAISALHEALAAATAAGVEPSAPELETLARAAAELLIARDPGLWGQMHSLASRAPTVASAIWTRYASGSSFRNRIEGPELPEALLTEAYLDLERLFPDKPQHDGAHWVSDIDYVERVQSGLLERLVNRSTPEAIAGVDRIMRALPEVTWLRFRLQEARRNYRAAARQLHPPAEVVRLIDAYRPQLPLRGELAATRSALARDRADERALTEIPQDADGPAAAPQDAGPIPAAARPLKVLSVATEWRSTHGGVSTLNRDFCTALAGQGHEVCCVVLDATTADIAAAAQARVRLIVCPPATNIFDQHRFLLLRLEHLEGFTPEVVVGHDHVTGAGALQVSKQLQCAYVHMVHTIPQDSEGLKLTGAALGASMTRGYDKSTAQLRLAKEAVLAVAIGPKIFGKINARLFNGPPVHELLPGLDSHLMAYVPDISRLTDVSCLMSARMEAAVLKGVLLACDTVKAVGQAQSWGPARPRLVLRGFDPGFTEVDFDKAIGTFDDYRACVHPMPYSDDIKEIQEDFYAASLVVMPSLSEGFGLSGLEGIAAGLPVVLSMESGLAEYLVAAEHAGDIPKGIPDACICDVHGPKADNIAAWQAKIAAILNDRPGAFARALALRTALTPILTWDRAAAEFVAAVLKEVD